MKLLIFGIFDLPVDQNHQRCKKQTPAEEIPDKKHRSKHHEMAPVVNAAVDTAFVFHDIGLERTEKQDADVIT